jgi:hypothetical protein
MNTAGFYQSTADAIGVPLYADNIIDAASAYADRFVGIQRRPMRGDCHTATAAWLLSFSRAYKAGSVELHGSAPP